ncbi:UNVERIFIED_ORG: transposase-like protein [Bacillus proteolyticus]
MVKKKRDPKSVKLAQSIFKSYQTEAVEDIQEALKDIFGPMFEAMLQGKMNHHLGYDSNSKERKEHKKRLNGYGKKKVKTRS